MYKLNIVISDIKLISKNIKTIITVSYGVYIAYGD